MSTFKDMTAQDKQILRVKLENADNMAEFLNVLNAEFNLSTCRPGLMTKKTISASMVSVILPMLNPIKK